ncbi:MAG: ABC transporter permease subunit [Cyclobacteriaceae bacterium]|nr:ABC transporter permease subunit [Cyclobacteriaceae bacterium]
MLKILKYSFFDLIRSRWSIIYFLFYFVTGMVLLYLSNDVSKAIVSLMNITFILTPLIGTIFGVMNFYNSREFIELLLAQPVPRKRIFLGMYLGISLSLSLSLLLGMGLPFVLYRIFISGHVMSLLILLLSGVFLTFIFTALSFYIALVNENRLKGFGMAILVWLFMSFIYDGIFLLSLFLLQEYPLEKFAIAMSMFNPIDLSRILIMLKLDISALMGYTGAVFNKFFGNNSGMFISILALTVWTVAPVLLILKKSFKKDF